MVVILVTGFGAFPNAPRNPTTALVARLAAHRARFERLGIRLESEILPVVYASVAKNLARRVAVSRPDAILHFGLAGRRTRISIETRAVNKLGTLHPDAAHCRAAASTVLAGGPLVRRSTFPAARLAATLPRLGITATLSSDAGDYVCNQTLYLSLAAHHARSVGFIHVPLPARRGGASRRPTEAALTRMAIQAVLIVAQGVRRGF